MTRHGKKTSGNVTEEMLARKLFSNQILDTCRTSTTHLKAGIGFRPVLSSSYSKRLFTSKNGPPTFCGKFSPNRIVLVTAAPHGGRDNRPPWMDVGEQTMDITCQYHATNPQRNSSSAAPRPWRVPLGQSCCAHTGTTHATAGVEPALIEGKLRLGQLLRDWLQRHSPKKSVEKHRKFWRYCQKQNLLSQNGCGKVKPQKTRFQLFLFLIKKQS